MGVVGVPHATSATGRDALSTVSPTAAKLELGPRRALQTRVRSVDAIGSGPDGKSGKTLESVVWDRCGDGLTAVTPPDRACSGEQIAETAVGQHRFRLTRPCRQHAQAQLARGRSRRATPWSCRCRRLPRRPGPPARRSRGSETPRQRATPSPAATLTRPCTHHRSKSTARRQLLDIRTDNRRARVR